MAQAKKRILNILRATASSIEKSHDYQWGHMGLCNCGFLAQEISSLKKDEIHRRAMQRHGDWNEQLNDYCSTSGMLMDDLITSMIDTGFDIDDLKRLETLSDPRVLQTLSERRYLSRNKKEDVILYLRAWAGQLEQEIIQKIPVPVAPLIQTVEI